MAYTKQRYIKDYCVMDEKKKENWIKTVEAIPEDSLIWTKETGALPDYKLLIKISTLGELREVRQALRAALGTWQDTLDHSWSSLGRLFVSWKSKENPSVVIWLESSPDTFPRELMEDNCKIVQEVYTETRAKLVCDRGE